MDMATWIEIVIAGWVLNWLSIKVGDRLWPNEENTDVGNPLRLLAVIPYVFVGFFAFSLLISAVIWAGKKLGVFDENL